MKKILGKIVFFLFALAVVSGSFFLDEKIIKAKEDTEGNRVSVVEKGGKAVFSRKNREYQASSGSARMIIALGDSAAVRLAPQSEAVLSLSEDKDFREEVRISVKKGKLWLNTLNSDLKAKISTSRADIEGDPGVFGIQYEDGKILLAAYRHDLRVGLANARLVLPERTMMEISEAKLRTAGDTISKLRYSKLAKEFPYFPLAEDDQWVSENKALDAKFAVEIRESVLREIRQNGPVLPPDDESILLKADNLANEIRLALTFDPQRRQKAACAQIMDYFQSSAHSLLIGKDQLARARLRAFSEMASAAMSEDGGNDAVFRGIQNRLDRFAFAQPKDAFYAVRSALRTVSRLEPAEVLRANFNDILDTANYAVDPETQQMTLTMLRRFASASDNLLGRISASAQSEDVFFIDVLLNRFFEANPRFMREEFLKISDLYERAYLRLLASTREESDDQKQFFIAQKLKRVESIDALMRNEKIPFQDARKAILYLIDQIERLKPTFPSTAVIVYFDQQIAQFGPLLSFLRSSAADSVHSSFKESFEEYQSAINDVRQITELLENASGGERISSVRREELAAIVNEDLRGKGISELDIVLPDAEGDPRVRITGAKLEDQTFSAVYDTASKVFSDIAVNGEPVPNAIRLENIHKFFQVRTGRLVLQGGQTAESLTEQPQEGSLLERVAQAAVAEQFQRLNVRVEPADFGMEDLRSGVIHIRLAKIGDQEKERIFSFDVVNNGSEAANLKVTTLAGEIPANETFVLNELPLRVERIFMRAALEAERQDTGTEGGSSTEDASLAEGNFTEEAVQEEESVVEN